MKALAVTLAVLAGMVSMAGSAGALPESGTLSIGDAQAFEGTFGTQPLAFRVTLSESSREPVSVGYRTQNETAQAPADYEPAQGTLQFAPGETSKNVEVQIRGDRAVEPDEFFSVILSNPLNATIAQPGGVGTGTIRNDDQPPAPPQGKVACKCRRVKTRLAAFNAHGTTTLVGKVTSKKEAAEFWDFVVKAELTCRAGDIVDCAGFVKTESPSTFPPFATQKPKLFRCKGKRCGEKRTFTLEVRIRITRELILERRKAKKPLKQPLRIRSGCRGKKGEVRKFTLVFANGNFFSAKLSDQNGVSVPG